MECFKSQSLDKNITQLQSSKVAVKIHPAVWEGQCEYIVGVLSPAIARRVAVRIGI